jgi:arsenate reductase (thioredoxin)
LIFDLIINFKMKNYKILILCTGNSCRSQMAEGILKSFNPNLKVFSAGTHPEKNVNPNAIEVMKEIDIDISSNWAKSVDEFINEDLDFVITVCDNAKETCPVFLGNVKSRIHIGFEDPAKTIGTKDQVLNKYRQIRDEINDKFREFYTTNLK